MSTAQNLDDIAMLGETPLGTGWMGAPKSTGYRLSISTAGGGRLGIDDVISLSVERRHTAISNWSATVPTQPDLDDHTLSRVRLAWGDTILFTGRLEELSGEIGAPVVSISGRGIGADLTRGKINPDLEHVRRWDAIGEVWSQYSDFSATVARPDSYDHPANGRISSGDNNDYSGTPMDVLKQLHEDAAMRFTIMHARPGRAVESYPRGTRHRRHDWAVFGGERDVSVMGYANRVDVTGALKPDGSGERFHAVAEDEQEIKTMRKRDIGNDGRVTYPIDDPSIKDDRDLGEDPDAQTGHQNALEVAKSKLADLVDKDSVGGTIDISPTVAAPGYVYYIPQFGGEPRAYGEGKYGEGTYGSEAGDYVPLNKVSYSISYGEEVGTCTLDFSRQGGLAATLEDAYGDSL